MPIPTHSRNYNSDMDTMEKEIVTKFSTSLTVDDIQHPNSNNGERNSDNDSEPSSGNYSPMLQSLDFSQLNFEISKATPLATVKEKKILENLSESAFNLKNKDKKERVGIQVYPGEFESESYFYPRVLNATIHPLVSCFFTLGNDRILARYAHLNPSVNIQMLRTILEYTPKHFHWAGSDLFHVTTSQRQRQMIIVEMNSCPSGQKSMPLLSDTDEFGGYKVVLESAFNHVLTNADPSLGDLAVVYDDNHMEASGYCTVMAEISKEPVWLVEYFQDDIDPPVRWVDKHMQIRDKEGNWHSIRACFRYVAQKPWTRIPLDTKTIVMNGIVSCLAGGRNKLMAVRAYESYNTELADTGLSIRIPETFKNVSKNEIPLWVDFMGGQAVIKVPYSNAGQGVYCITKPQDLEAFMSENHHYDKFIVQSLVGNYSWSSSSRFGKFYHVGTMPNKKNDTFVSDLRMMVTGDKNGFRPVSIYARRARKPLLKNLNDDPSITSWDMLGTNLSVKVDSQTWITEPQRLLLMDHKDFNVLGINVDDLIDAYVQTVMSVIAIDKLCERLTPSKGKFDFELFRALNPDEALISEIIM